MAILSPTTGPLATIFNTVTSQAWGPLVSLCRNGTIAQLKGIQVGKLALYESNSSKGSVTFGNEAPGAPVAVLNVHDEKFWVRLALFADMVRLAREDGKCAMETVAWDGKLTIAGRVSRKAILLGEVSLPDLTAFFKRNYSSYPQAFILNRNHLSNGSTLTSVISTGLAGLVRGSNNLKNARLNIMAHYDISNEMFASFMSPDMTYSCPIWLPKSDPNHSSETLEAAQMRKLDRFIDNTHVKSTDHVLEIGTGWGSLAMRAVQRTGCRVTSLTLSIEQKELAEERIRDAGLSDRIKVMLCDYRDLTVPAEGPFDKVISIEMLEAVGKEYLEEYFRCIHKLLKTDGGIACFQCITMPEARYEAYAKSDDFIRRYIFPGGHLPTVTQLTNSITNGSNGSLVIDDIENIGPHYAKALRLWRTMFLDNWDGRIKPQLLRDQKGKGKGLDQDSAEVFKRKWEYYFRYSEAGFATKTLGDVIITVGREGAVQMMENVPL